MNQPCTHRTVRLSSATYTEVPEVTMAIVKATDQSCGLQVIDPALATILKLDAGHSG